MNKATIIKEIKTIISNEFKSKQSLREYTKQLNSLNTSSLLNLLGFTRENSSYNYDSKTWVSKNVDTLQENCKISELINYITLEEINNTRNFYNQQKEMIEIDNLFGLMSENSIIDCRKNKRIKKLELIKKTNYNLTSKEYKQRKGFLIESSINYPKSFSFFGKNSYMIGYEYKSGSTEIYNNDNKNLTVIVTDLYNTGILSSEEVIKNICISLYNDFFFNSFDTNNILWIFEIPISENKSKFYEINFKVNFKFKIRYIEEIYRLNRIYSMNLQDKQDITILTDINIKQIKDLNQMITLHKLKSVLSY